MDCRCENHRAKNAGQVGIMTKKQAVKMAYPSAKLRKHRTLEWSEYEYIYFIWDKSQWPSMIGSFALTPKLAWKYVAEVIYQAALQKLETA
jgi:hypothetical protein